ncbi:MAG: GDP-mannose 4,6-dehydratase [Prolixibacteraceae bacterium]|nr:GDP-mannose 4,6-dehydratase [Prolixibacteraceae bacterium]
MEKILVTGSAGFIGFHLTKKLINSNYQVYGIDNINDYYDVNLKYARLAEMGITPIDSQCEDDNFQKMKWGLEISSKKYNNYRFKRLDIQDKENLLNIFQTEKFDYVINLAGQAGVRYSIENPDVYIQSNIVGFFNILEACRRFKTKKLIYASSSSVYGNNTKIPFSISDKTDEPVSLYAATKKSNELMAHAYSHLYQIPTIGLRFFTVYGSWGRPDMSPILFANAICEGKKLEVFNNGDMERDFTHVSDIVEGIGRVIKISFNNGEFFKLFNIGCGAPENLIKFIKTIEDNLGKKANLQYLPMQPGDVKQTWADTNELTEYCNYKPSTSIDEGIKEFISWYCKFYNVP